MFCFAPRQDVNCFGIFTKRATKRQKTHHYVYVCLIVLLSKDGAKVQKLFHIHKFYWFNFQNDYILSQIYSLKVKNIQQQVCHGVMIFIKKFLKCLAS